MANRYSRNSVSQFNPLSLQEVFMVPMAKQQQHDAIVTKADELGLFDVNALEQDKDLLNEFTGSYRSKLDNLTNDIMSQGIDGMSKTKLRSLISERNKFLNEGDGKNIASNYKAYTDNKKELDKLYQSGKISRDKYLLGMQQSLSNYKGVAQGDKYNPFMAVQDVDFMKKAQEIAAAISNNPNKITEFSNLQYNPTTGKYVDMTTNREFTQEGAIREAVKAGLALDPDVMSDLGQRQSLGMLGNQTVEDYIGNIGTLNEAIYAKNNYRSNRSFVGIDHSQIASDGTSSPSYEYDADKTLQIRDDKLLDTINMVLDGSPTAVDRDTGERVGNAGMLSGKHGYLYEAGPTTYKTMKDDVREEYNNIYSALVRSNKIDPSVAKDSPEAFKSVKQYLENKRAQQFKFQPIKYTDGLVKTYDNRSIKMDNNTPEKLAKGISLNPEDRQWIDDEKGKSLNTFDDMPTKYREELIKGTARVSSVMGSRNVLRSKYGKTVDPRALTSMLEVQFSDGKKYLVSRSQGEMNTRSYAVDTQYNELWNQMAMLPDIDIPTVLPGIGQARVQALMTPIISEDGRVLEIKIIDEQGNVGYATQDEFEANYKASYGIK